jgi:hypothetical protein
VVVRARLPEAVLGRIRAEPGIEVGEQSR